MKLILKRNVKKYKVQLIMHQQLHVLFVDNLHWEKLPLLYLSVSYFYRYFKKNLKNKTLNLVKSGFSYKFLKSDDF